MKRILIILLVRALAIVPLFAQQKPGVPGVQYPMSSIIPDAEYAITGGSPDWLAMGEDMVWVNSRPTDVVLRMDPKTSDVVAVVPVKNPCSGLIIGAGTLWSPSCVENVVYRVDVATNQVVAKIPVSPANNEGGIAFGAGSAWLPSDPKGIVTRIDPATNSISAQIKVAPGSFTAIFGFGLVWVSSTEKNLVTVIHPASNEVIAEIPVDLAPRFMAAGEGFLWTLNQTKGTVSKIDPLTKKVVATIEAGVPGTGGDIAAGEGAVWVTARTIPVTRIDPATNQVTAQFVGPGGDAIRVGHGSVWLSNGRLSNVWRFIPSKVSNALTSTFVDPGVLPRNWRTGGPKCSELPKWEVHEYNANFFIIRESGCTHYEKPFLYLIFGREKALLEDTGAGQVDTAGIVMDLVSLWSKRNNRAPVPLLVVHSHGHGDHVAGDAQFKGMPNVHLVPATVPELQKAFGLSKWPDDAAQIDLGGRILDLIPIPGHNDASIALYDRQTGILLTGDSFYPGRLYVGEAEFPAFVSSTQRLVDFTRDKPVAHILGTHIEQSRTPFVDYPRGTMYQPEEHSLELSRGVLLELNDALIKLNGKLEKVALRDITLSPREPR
jgi:hydroxyacylglutathione hydrolase